jgi:hypothetical protein
MIESYPVFIQDKIHEITSHTAWFGDLTGTQAEFLLRSKSDMTYVLRQGERADHFYLSYVKDKCVFVHIPFTANHPSKMWYYLNGSPHLAETLEKFIPEIMHVEQGECSPLNKMLDL